MKGRMKGKRKQAKAAAFFDLERTITRHSVEREIYLEMYRQGVIPLGGAVKTIWGYAKYNLGLMKDLEPMRHEAAAAHGGKGVKVSRAGVKAYFDSHLRGSIYREAVEAIDAFKGDGVRVYIVSTTFDLYVEPYAEFLGVDGYFGVRLGRSGGVYTGGIDGEIYHHEKKAAALLEIARARGIDLSASYAYGDSVNDRHMLQAVGNPRAVNPDGGLKRLARARGWPVLAWRRLYGR